MFAFREDCAYALLVPTSMGVRLTPVHGQPAHCSDTFVMQATSAETNVASMLSYLGLRVKVLTTFVKASPIARFIKNDLARRHMDYEGKEVEQGGPWGYRHQFNIADSGYGCRGPRVHNDRAGEVGRTLGIQDFDLDRIFRQEGVKIMHLSGLIAALSPETGRFCLELAAAAKKHGTCVSFDLNYRESFWQNRESELRDIFRQIAGMADTIVGNEEDIQRCFKIEGPDVRGVDLSSKIDDFQRMIDRARRVFPNATVLAITLREVIDANRHRWGAILSEGDNWHIVTPREIMVLDRVGGGDAFVGGLLYAMLKRWEPEQWIQFGWASGALATTFLTDHTQPADERQLWKIWEGNSRVER